MFEGFGLGDRKDRIDNALEPRFQSCRCHSVTKEIGCVYTPFTFERIYNKTVLMEATKNTV